MRTPRPPGRRNLFRLALATLLAHSGAIAADGAEVPKAAVLRAEKPVEVISATQFDIDSTIVGRTYRVFVGLPLAPAPPKGYPLVVHSDGFLFPIVATESILTAYGGGRPAIVVGITWATVDPAEGLRYRNKDLTPPADTFDLSTLPGQPPARAQDYGGAEAFYRFIAEELRPALRKRYAIDPDDQTLYGHSFGGLFSLHVLFNHPEAFQTYVAASPSIFWNKKAILAGEPRFTEAVQSRRIAPRVLIAVGDQEQNVVRARPGTTLEAARSMAAGIRMVDEARELADRLSRIQGAPRYQVVYRNFADQDHLSVMGPSIGLGLRFALLP